MGEHDPKRAQSRADDRKGSESHENRAVRPDTASADDDTASAENSADNGVRTSIVGYTAEGRAIYETTDRAGVTTTSIEGSQGAQKYQDSGAEDKGTASIADIADTVEQDETATKIQDTDFEHSHDTGSERDTGRDTELNQVGTKTQGIKTALNTPVKLPSVGKRKEAIHLPRLRITKVHYAVLAVFALAGYMSSKSIILYFDFYYQALLDYRFSGLPAALLVIACLFLMVFSINAARAHSKSYNTNITNVFEYMGRQGKRKFSYLLESDTDSVGDGVVLFKRVEDNNDTGEPEVVAETLPTPSSRNFFPKRKQVKISDIKEVRLVNQNQYSEGEPDFLEPNKKIDRMLKSDRQQLIAFVGAYIFAMFSGFFIALII